MWPLPLILGLGGAGVGALFNRKDPLKGALLGGALGAGASFIPGAQGLLGAAAPGSQAGMLAAQEAGMGALGTAGWGGATTGVQGALNSGLGASTGAQVGGLLGNADKYATPVMKGIETAKAMQPQDQPIMPSPIVPPTASPTLAQIAMQPQQDAQMMQQMEMERRKRRQERIASMGGLNGFA